MYRPQRRTRLGPETVPWSRYQSRRQCFGRGQEGHTPTLDSRKFVFRRGSIENLPWTEFRSMEISNAIANRRTYRCVRTGSPNFELTESAAERQYLHHASRAIQGLFCYGGCSECRCAYALRLGSAELRAGFNKGIAAARCDGRGVGDRKSVV